MILTKNDLKYYLNEDKKALKKHRKFPLLLGDEIWKFEIILRKHEYYSNAVRKSPITILLKYYYAYRHYQKGIKLGFSIPINTFKEGLRINHYGLIVVNPHARIGRNCDIHQGVNIGQGLSENDVPIIGDNVWIAPGVKIFNNIKIGHNIAIGANSVVNKSFEENNITIAGMPAKKIKNIGNIYVESKNVISLN